MANENPNAEFRPPGNSPGRYIIVRVIDQVAERALVAEFQVLQDEGFLEFWVLDDGDSESLADPSCPGS